MHKLIVSAYIWTVCDERADLTEDKTVSSGAKANYVCTDCGYCSLSSLDCI